MKAACLLLTLATVAGTLPSAALTRAEIVERFRTPPVTQVLGLVQVWADCPRDVRLAHQMPLAGYAAQICRTLYRASNVRERKFDRPGIVLHLGDATNVTNVVVRVRRREDGSRVTRIFLLAPAASDAQVVTDAVVQGFYRAVLDREIAVDEARRRLLHADPARRAADEQARLVAWRERGEYAPGTDDEDYLKVRRKVLLPGACSREDARTFASRLMLYPISFGSPFCGRYRELTMREALAHFRKDPQVRFAAFAKAPRIVVAGGGRGEAMTAAAEAYSEFLFALARAEEGDAEIAALLDAAEEKLMALAGPRPRAAGVSGEAK